MRIMFDMDGTIADLYAVDNWLSKLQASDPSPYVEAEVMLNMSIFARYLNKLQSLGYEIGIISWTSKNGTERYNRAVEVAKLNWLHDHLRSVTFDDIYIVEYGTPKQDFADENDILFDDSKEIRNDWAGKAYEPSEILSILSGLLHQE